MADNIDRLIDEQNTYYNSSIYGAFEYQKKRKNGAEVDLREAENILDDYLRSVLAGYRAKVAKLEVDARDADFVTKSDLKIRIRINRKIMSQIERVLNLDIITNPYATGELYEGFCPVFEEETMAAFTLFNEIKRYYETHTDSNDRDRLEILWFISDLEGLVEEPQSNIVSHEKEELNKRVSVLNAAFEDNPLLPLNFVLEDFTKGVLHNKEREESEFRMHVFDAHAPQYESSFAGAYDGFGKSMASYTADIITERVERYKDQYDFADFKVREICNVLARRAEVEEIKKIANTLLLVLEEKNGLLMDSSANLRLDYSASIEKCSEFVKFLETLSKKYNDRLNRLHLDDLMEAIKNARGIPARSKASLENKFHDIDQRKPLLVPEYQKEALEKPLPPVMDEPLPLPEENKKRIEEGNMSRELLNLAAEDLFMFGNVISSNIDNLTDEEVSKVINHAEKLRTLVGLSDEDKAKIRASWPRITEGRLVVSAEPSMTEINDQMKRDELRSMYHRIESYAFEDKEPQL